MPLCHSIMCHMAHVGSIIAVTFASSTALLNMATGIVIFWNLNFLRLMRCVPCHHDIIRDRWYPGHHFEMIYYVYMVPEAEARQGFAWLVCLNLSDSCSIAPGRWSIESFLQSAA